MTRFLFLLLPVLLLISFSRADPLVLLDDYAEEIVEQYEEGGTFLYSYHYPQVDEDGEGGIAVNYFYLDLIDYDNGFTVPFLQETHEGADCSTVITYTVTCNNDEYFSVLLRKDKDFSEDKPSTEWIGNTFSRLNPNYGYTTTLPQLLGLLDVDENDTWYQDRQTAKADDLVRELVWAMIEQNDAGIDYNDDLTQEDLSGVFFPEEDFYLDENGDPVFFLQPGVAAPDHFGLLKYPVPLEIILDEM